jgi:cobalt-zinc-cadmium efflux system outer membrane protein
VRIITQYFICLLLVAEFATAAPQALPELVQVAFDHNPDIHAARLSWQASTESIPQARSLPDPMLRFDYFGESVQTRVGPQESRIGLSQSFPFPGTRDQAAEVAARGARVQELAYQIALRDVIVELKLAYFELLYLRNAIAITMQNEALLEQIVALANAQQAKLYDLLKAQAQQAQLGYDLVALRDQEELAVTRLNALLNRPSNEPIELTWPDLRSPQVDPAELEAKALVGRQELLMARAKVDKLEAVVDLAQFKSRPSFTVSATHIDVNGGRDPWMLGVGVSLPIWRDRNESRVAEAELNAESASLQTGGLENKTRVAVKAILYQIANARRLTLLYQDTLIPQARQSIDLAQQWQEGDFSGLLETQTVWLSVNLARLRALVDHQQHLARLEQVIGGSLPETESPLPAPTLAESADIEIPEPVRVDAGPDWLASNPEVQAAVDTVESVRQQLSQADALSDVLRQYRAFGAPAMASVQFPGPSALKGKLIGHDIALAEQALAITRRDTATAMRSARFELVFVEKSIAINREQKELLEQIIAVAETKVRTDRGKYQGLIMAQVEMAKLTDVITTLEETRETVVARINTLLNRVPDHPLELPPAAVFADSAISLAAWYEKALAGRQELRTQQLRIERTRTMIELATQMASKEASWFATRQAFVRELKQEVAAKEHALTGLEDRTRLAVKEAQFALQRAQRSLALYQDSLLPKAKQSLDAAAAGYRAGQIDFLTFLDAERTLLAFRVEEQRALRDRGVAAAQLDKLSGVIR